jgi:hypothetical protein
MKAAEQKQQCRYAIFDAKYQKSGSSEHQKLFFLFWWVLSLSYKYCKTISGFCLDCLQSQNHIPHATMYQQ